MKILQSIRLLKATSDPNLNCQQSLQNKCWQASNGAPALRAAAVGEWSEAAGLQHLPRGAHSACPELGLGICRGRSPPQHRRGRSRPIGARLGTSLAGSGVVGNGCPPGCAGRRLCRCSLPVPNELLQLGFLFFICALRVSRHNYSGRRSQNGRGLQFSFPNHSAGNRGEGGRDTKNPKPQKRMKTYLNSVFKMRKSESPSHSTQLSSRSTQPPTTWR